MPTCSQLAPFVETKPVKVLLVRVSLNQSGGLRRDIAEDDHVEGLRPRAARLDRSSARGRGKHRMNFMTWSAHLPASQYGAINLTKRPASCETGLEPGHCQHHLVPPPTWAGWEVAGVLRAGATHHSGYNNRKKTLVLLGSIAEVTLVMSVEPGEANQ